MKQKHIYLEDLHFENVMWKKRLDFEKDELKAFQNRLEEVTPRWTKQEVLKKVEHFQNVFHRHNNVLDTLIHNINEEEHNLSEKAKANPVAIDRVYFDDHVEMRDQVETQLKLYSELKTEYLEFLRDAM